MTRRFGSSCGACKFLRRKCTTECVFSPYYSYDEAANDFSAVHKVFGASNVSKLLLHLPIQNRSHAAITISYQALARMRDPVYGCVSQIYALQQQVANLQEEIYQLGDQIANNSTNQKITYQDSHGHQPISEEMNDAFYSQTNSELTTSNRWHGEMSYVCNEQNILDMRFSEGIDQGEILSWIGNDTTSSLNFLD